MGRLNEIIMNGTQVGVGPDMADYYTKTEVDASLGKYVSNDGLVSAIQGLSDDDKAAIKTVVGITHDDYDAIAAIVSEGFTDVTINAQ